MTDIKWNSDGLVPAIAVDAYTNEVLMQAYMNEEALRLTLETGRAHYYSRSRGKLWLKGETSGHFQMVADVYTDCDNDSILLRVIQAGTACHTGSRTCFFRKLKSFSRVADISILQKNIDTIEDRAEHPQEGSYTNYLLAKGREKICKKVGEESTECVIAAMKGDNEELANELADLYFHTLVLMKDRGLAFNDVLKVLEDRHNSERKRNYKA